MNNWIDKHSVNCFFCNELVDERECMPADGLNGHDGGDVCPACIAKFKNDEAFVVEHEDLNLYWSNDEGWTHLGDATRFTQDETRRFHLPMGERCGWAQVRDVIEMELDNA